MNVSCTDDVTYLSHISGRWPRSSSMGSCEAIIDPDHSEATMTEDTAEGLKDVRFGGGAVAYFGCRRRTFKHVIARRKKARVTRAPSRKACARSVESAGERDVARGSESENGLTCPIQPRVHVPHAVAIDDEIGLAVAVPVEQIRLVLRQTAEMHGDIADSIAVRVDVPGTIAIDHQVRDAVAVHVAGERDIAGNAAEIEDLVSGAVEKHVHIPDAVPIKHQIVLAVVVEVRHQRLVGQVAEQDRAIADAVEVDVEEPHSSSIDADGMRSAEADTSDHRYVAGRSERHLAVSAMIEPEVEKERVGARPIERELLDRGRTRDGDSEAA